MTVAAFMEAALYHPEFGYYARAVQRSGRAGDFFTSVDVGPLFGQLLARQLAELQVILTSEFRIPNCDLVEAGAGNGRLTSDILRALKQDSPDTYRSINAHLVETSSAARSVHRDTLGDVVDRLASSSATLPESFEGVLIANELLDAMPVHQAVMRADGLHEIFVDGDGGDLKLREGPLSTSRLADYFADAGVRLEPGWRAEVSLAAINWIATAAARLKRGFMILIDYGHEASELYSVTHAAGTLTTFSQHRSAGPESSTVPWLRRPGEQDLTAHVDFTSVRKAAESAGCVTLGLLDQMYFLLALAADRLETLNARERLALKTLVMPGGLGSTMKVLILAKNVGQPSLTGLSGPKRLT